MTCPCQHAMPIPGAFPKAAGRLSLDRAALRRELGGDAGVREAMTAKATGRPSANVSVLWGYFTKAVYKSGDLPWLATREALQNSADALKAAVRARKLKAGAACWVDIGALDLWPQADGPLVGAGSAHADLPWDYCSVHRPDPPTAGALEPGTPPNGSFAAWVDPTERCPAVEGEDTAEGGGDTAGGPGDRDGDDASDADGGCGCAAFPMGRGGQPPRNAPLALLLGGLAARVALRRRAGAGRRPLTRGG